MPRLMISLRRCLTFETAKEASAMIPPSPSLSARITMRTYLIETMSVSVQNTIEAAP